MVQCALKGTHARTHTCTYYVYRRMVKYFVRRKKRMNVCTSSYQAAPQFLCCLTLFIWSIFFAQKLLNTRYVYGICIHRKIEPLVKVMLSVRKITPQTFHMHNRQYLTFENYKQKFVYKSKTIVCFRA